MEHPKARAAGRSRLAFVALAGALACSAETPHLQHTVRDSAGVRLIDGPADDSAYAVRIQPLGPVQLLVRSTEVGESVAVTVERSRHVATDGVDRLYVLDRVEQRVLAFGDEGELLWQRGRPGGGPGEFRFPEFLTASSAEIRVIDTGRAMLVRFTRDGEPLDDLSFARFGHPYGGIEMWADTAVIHQATFGASVPAQTLWIKTSRDSLELIHLTNETLGTARFRCGKGTVIMNGSPRIFAPRIAWTTGPDGIAVARQSRYAISLNAGGRIIGRIGRPIEGRRTTDRDVARLYPRGSYEGRKTCLVDAATVAEQYGVEPVLPVLRDLRFAPDGTLWVERYTLPDEEPVIDVFDLERGYLGSIRGVPMPAGFLSGGRLIGLVPDPDEIELYRIAMWRLGPAGW